MSKPFIPQNDFTESTLESKVVYQGHILKVREDKVRLSDGTESSREWVEHPGAVIVIAIMSDGKILMERQYRYPLSRHMIELPAGKIDAGEEPLSTAKRELLEETGYVANEWKHIMTVHPCIGYSNERMEFYYAKNLTLQKQQLDKGEFLDVFSLTLPEALEFVTSGDITDIKTITGLFWLDRQK